ncbi:TIGR02677 family protein [Desulfofalx alkaliphila]|uniref:TIGR02677 family protein n=1 Tax=Desulfofalx alkaliphila TaxID=105483 RepID=UPI0004E15DFC|nr:TIGR02677 family protein [Desulfofalx alkaliphila]
MDEKLLKPIIEAAYLTAGNAWRYRSILRFFYIQHERMRYYLFPEEVLEYLKKSQHFIDYTEEQLQQDLNQLVHWKNLIPRQDTGKVNTIEEFKKKKFRYQCTPYTIEIERMVHGLEQMGESFGGSLERTLFDRILDALIILVDQQKIEEVSDEELNTFWNDLYGNFRKLTENATDYLAHMQSEKVEEMMLTEAFLSYKDAITEYLRNFMSVLQRTSFRIEAVLQQTSKEQIELIANRLADYYLSIPRLDRRQTKDELVKKYMLQWLSLKTWFLGSDGRESDLLFLQNATNETIRRITRFAQRLGERHHNFRSRRKDYLHLAAWFEQCTDISEAHKISACVFGVFHTRHIYTPVKGTEDIYAEVWDEKPTEITVNPRVRTYKGKTKPGAIEGHKEEKERMMAAYLREREAERQLIEQLINQDYIVFKNLPVVDPYIRKTLLNWIGKCMADKNMTAKTEAGRKLRLLKQDDSYIVLRSRDGNLRMPNYVFQFLD